MGRVGTSRYDRRFRVVVGKGRMAVATTEHTTIESPCPCGNGAIAVTRSEPDHGYVRPNQIGYAAKIKCRQCSESYEIRDGDYGRFPWLVLRSEADRQRAARAKLAALEAEVKDSDATARLRARIVVEVDGQPSMAAAHRVLTRFGLAPEAVWTYRKQPYGGEEAVRRAGSSGFARIGSMPEMGRADTPAFNWWAKELEELEKEVRWLEPAPVETGGTWLRA